MVVQDGNTITPVNPVQISVEYRPGKGQNIFHIIDRDLKEIKLKNGDAVELARSILKIVKGKETD
jgi:hypothetical protein